MLYGIMADALEHINIESSHLWRNVLPIARINGLFIDKKGQEILE